MNFCKRELYKEVNAMNICFEGKYEETVNSNWNNNVIVYTWIKWMF